MLIYYDMSAPTANPSMVVAPSASNSTDKSDDGDSGSGTNYGAVIGGVVAGVALGLVIIIAALCLRRKPIRRRAAQNSTTGTAVSHPGGYQRAPQTPGSDMVPFQYRLSNFSADAGMGMKSSRPYSMSSYGMYDSSLRDFHEGLSPRSQSPASPGPFSMRSGRRPGSSRPGSSRPESMAAPPRLSISEIAGTQLDVPFLGSPTRSRPILRPISPYGRPTSQPMSPCGRPTSRPISTYGRPPSRPGSRPTSRPPSRPGSAPPSRPGSRPSSRPGSRPSSRPPPSPTSRPPLPLLSPTSRTPLSPAPRIPASSTAAKGTAEAERTGAKALI